ncbi:hypothetical protein GDO86_014935 [Hymenochirus boettgeri]|uniref:Hemicentin-1 n=1 Tax=Hymenochirus boettgeri TaxID=247094 RepID=A0A8T2JVU4_9PIPI|nr:hypothetical protein GDO86_014935 [Hymenochirus boettgeri]
MSRVYLECNATGLPEPTLMWLKDKVPVSTASAGLQILEQGRILSLSAAQTSDSGVYTCVAVNSAGEDSHDIVLEMYVPPSIIGEEINSSLIVNEPLRLECQTTAIPIPIVTWLKDGHPLLQRPGVRITEDGRYLQIDQAQLRDAGRYTCEASNDVGRTEKHYNIIVWVPPSFQEPSTPHFTVIEGQPVSLTCECQGVPPPTLSWTKNGLPLVMENSGIVTAGGRLIHIGKVQVSDEGTYTCVCNNDAGSAKQEYWLEVYAHPIIIGSSNTPKQMTVTRDSQVTMKCLTTGKPAPSVTWLKDGYPLGSGKDLILQGNGQQLTISRVQPSHSGHYVCVAVNAAGQTDIKYELLVQVPPEITNTAAAPHNISTTLHGTLTITCEASGIPPPVITWYRNNGTLSPGPNLHLQSGGRVLRLTHAQIQDGGHYTCLVTNAAGQVKKDFFVDILVPPSIDEEEDVDLRVPEGQSVVLNCKVSGHPKPLITWLRDSQPLQSADDIQISPDGSELHIQTVNVFNAGHYTCLASNAIADKSKHFILTVLVGPTISGPFDDEANEDVIVIVNNPFSLICEALGFPIPSVIWLKNGEPFKDSHNLRLLPGGHGLQILNAQEEDSGQYTCVVTNDIGEAVRNYEVKVFIPPAIKRDDSNQEVGIKEIKAKVNSSLTLHCESQAVPKPSLHWYKDGKLLESSDGTQIQRDGQELQIQPIRVSDSGRYTCVATNVAGEDEKDFYVNVQVPPVFYRPGGSSAAFELLLRDDGEELTEHREVIANNPISLSCDTNAIPPPVLTWYKDGQLLSSSDGMLILLDGRILQISMAHAKNAGKYTCKATNEAGEDKLNYELVVMIPPVMTGTTDEPIQEVSIIFNQTAELTCEASGIPPPSMTWLRNGLPLSTANRYQILNEGKTLHISGVQVSDIDSYVCVAENSAGFAERLFTLMVHVTPVISGPNSENISVILHNSVSLMCDVQSHHASEIMWYKDGQLLTPTKGLLIMPGGQVLQITRAQLSNQGTYVCKVYNPAGSAEKVLQLMVYVPPRIEESPHGAEETVLRLGDSLNLQCKSDAVPQPTVTWYKNGQQIFVSDEIRIHNDGQRLEILNVKASDKGHYNCKVSNIAGEVELTYTVIIHAPPSIRSPQNETIQLLIGNSVVLSCETEGSPPPVVTWLKDGEPLEHSDRGVIVRGSRLQINRLQPSHAGQYRCIAQNHVSEVHKDFVLQVQVAPRIFGSEIPSERSFQESQEVRLECRAEGIPAPDIFWFKDGNPLELTSIHSSRVFQDGNFLILRSIQMSDSGRYACVARNAAGEDSKIYVLNILVPPTFESRSNTSDVLSSVPGGQVTLECHATGTLPMKLSWFKDGQPLSTSRYVRIASGGRLLRISQVQVSDAGTYTCVASSPAGAAEKTFILHIESLPILERSESTEEVTAIKSASVTFTCEAHGTPKPSLTWEKNGQPLSLQNNLVSYGLGTRLHLESVHVEDSGLYSCIAVNAAGRVGKHFRLTVLEPPSIEGSILPKDVSLISGSSLELECRATGIPAPEITWEKDGRPLSRPDLLSRNGTTLRIEQVKAEDAGVYVCVATSPSGRDSRATWVRMKVPPSVVGPNEPRSLSVSMGGQLVMECKVEADPPPSIQWYKGDVPLQMDGRVQVLSKGRYIQIYSLRPSDSGEYTCVATNPAGRTSLHFIVQILLAPMIQTGPSVVSVSVNQTAVLPCRMEGIPPPAASWRKDGNPLSVEISRIEFPADGSLKIPHALLQDSGYYLCTASNSAGVARRGVELRVFVNGEFSEWQEWGPCTRTCGQGVQERVRLCNNPPPANGGRLCLGQDVEMRACKLPLCPVDGGWTGWNRWGQCSTTCGEGTRQRTRSCFSPPPQNGGKPCVGNDKESEICLLPPCQVVPPRVRASVIGIINDQDFGISSLSANLTENPLSGLTMITSSIENIPPSVGPLLKILVPMIAPLYWTAAFAQDDTVNGFSMTKGVFRKETQIEFPTGELLRVTHIARGLDTEGTMWFDVVLNGFVPTSLASSDVVFQEYTETYVQTGPGQIHARASPALSTGDSFLSLHCNHTVEYNPDVGRQRKLTQRVHVGSIRSSYLPGSEELRFQLTASLREGLNGGSCPLGFTYSAESYCTDEDECDLHNNPCSHSCHNNIGSFFCSCPVGFTLAPDGRNCRDIDECTVGAHRCDAGQQCINTAGSYQCLLRCAPGFRPNAEGTACEDINECLRSVCQPQQHCKNTIGSYQCVENCPPGTMRSESGTCIDIDECQSGSHRCRYNQLCENSVGGYRCTCPRGYRSQGVGRPCLDINECQQMPKPCAYECQNIAGSYKCLCPPGKELLGDGRSCAGLERLDNTSALGLAGAQSDGTLTNGRIHGNNVYTWLSFSQNGNLIGQSSSSRCPSGFVRRNGVCTDIDECVQRNPCQHECRNTEGSYQCLCPAGYRLLPNNRNCQDIDECTEQRITCGINQMCFILEEVTSV